MEQKNITNLLYDTHAHLDDEQFDDDRESIIEKIKTSGVGLVNNIGANMESSRTGIALAEKYDFIYATVGVHPSDTKDMTDSDLNELRNLATHKKVVAIGEIGLDYHYDDTDPQTQKKWFAAQLELAKELDLPVVIHDRESSGDCIEILKKSGVSKAVIHCFSGSAETARQIIDMGFYISFTGVLTFKNARRAIEALKVIPLDRVFVETDSPYMAPEPHRGKRNDSSYVIHVAEKLAEIKEVSLEDAIKITTQNAIDFFGINA